MTTAKQHYPISTMTLAPDAAWTAGAASNALDPSTTPVAPGRWSRTRLIREHAGLLAVYAAIAALVGVSLLF
jgi:hypothetical protein